MAMTSTNERIKWSMLCERWLVASLRKRLFLLLSVASGRFGPTALRLTQPRFVTRSLKSFQLVHNARILAKGPLGSL